MELFTFISIERKISMKTINRLIFKGESTEEYLPGYSEEFPLISSYVEMDKYRDRYVPWHWHDTLELFYVESGVLEYYTPQGRCVFSAGSGGLTNSNVLHMSKLQPDTCDNILFVHLFDPILICGERGNLIDQKYIRPFITDSHIELITFMPGGQDDILKLLRESFLLKEEEKGYELLMRDKLSAIWLKIMDVAQEQIHQTRCNPKSSAHLKQMMIYIQEHYPEKISISQLAGTVYLSERGCYRLFQEYLHMTPADYIRSCRLQAARRMLLEGNKSLAEISQACGMGSSSYFGKIFKEDTGCTPLEYRQKWQDRDI